jgi:hypothetical protein
MCYPHFLRMTIYHLHRWDRGPDGNRGRSLWKRSQVSVPTRLFVNRAPIPGLPSYPCGRSRRGRRPGLRQLRVLASKGEDLERYG